MSRRLGEDARRIVDQETHSFSDIRRVLAFAAKLTPSKGRLSSRIRKLLLTVRKNPQKLSRREGKTRRALALLLARREEFRSVLGDDWVDCLHVLEKNFSLLIDFARNPNQFQSNSRNNSASAIYKAISDPDTRSKEIDESSLPKMAFESDEEGPPTQLGRYKIEGELGRGGAGVVYLGSDRNGRQVALKTVLDLSNERLSTTLMKEALVAAKLTSANCVRILDIFESRFGGRPRPVIVMEYVPGVDAEAFFEDGVMLRSKPWPITPTAALLVLEQMLTGIAAAHEDRLIHRDVKPSNFLVAENIVEALEDLEANRQLTPRAVETVFKESRHNAWIKLNDLGLARQKLERRQTMTASIADAESRFGSLDLAFADPKARLSLIEVTLAAGTPVYMAPEQLQRPFSLSERTDVFALGLVFYTVLTGAPVEDGRRFGEGVHMLGSAQACMRELMQVSRNLVHAIDIHNDPHLIEFQKRYPDKAEPCLQLLQDMTKRNQAMRQDSRVLLKRVQGFLKEPSRTRRRQSHRIRRVTHKKTAPPTTDSQQRILVAVVFLLILATLVLTAIIWKS